MLVPNVPGMLIARTVRQAARFRASGMASNLWALISDIHATGRGTLRRHGRDRHVRCARGKNARKRFDGETRGLKTALRRVIR
jgi:hypothetical protein